MNTEVTVELPGGAEVVSIITKASAERLHLRTGIEVYAVVKASDVMIALDSSAIAASPNHTSHSPH